MEAVLLAIESRDSGLSGSAGAEDDALLVVMFADGVAADETDSCEAAPFPLSQGFGGDGVAMP